jgi:hypothetical protein
MRLFGLSREACFESCPCGIPFAALVSWPFALPFAFTPIVLFYRVEARRPRGDVDAGPAPTTEAKRLSATVVRLSCGGWSGSQAQRRAGWAGWVGGMRGGDAAGAVVDGGFVLYVCGKRGQAKTSSRRNPAAGGSGHDPRLCDARAATVGLKTVGC